MTTITLGWIVLGLWLVLASFAGQTGGTQSSLRRFRMVTFLPIFGLLVLGVISRGSDAWPMALCAAIAAVLILRENRGEITS